LNRHRDTGVCTHDHAHGEPCGHDHHHHHDDGDAHAHSHGDGCCGHDHDDHHHHSHAGHDHAHSHSHGCCGHDHDDHHHSHTDHDHDHDHAHSHGHGCCGHDHHDHEDDEESHIHTHDHEETASGLFFSLVVLILPLLVATAYSRDRFSSEYLAKWGKIERQMMQMRIAERRGSAPANSTTSPDNPYTQAGIDAAAGKAGDPSATAGSDNASQAWGTFTLEDLKKMVPQNEKGEFLLDVPQIFYTAGDKELMQVMEGIPVETTAQLMAETLHNPDNTRLKAFRLFIECCAADARPLSIPIDFGKAPPEYTEMGWYKIYGKLHYSHENEEIIPLLQIERIEATSEPTDGLLF
ncbi:MAG TPA: hypothetical protein PLA50_01150, partial [Bacteroidia bacterium]|nr:hypothetical protein [Bacteroidia bacterium]